MRRAAKIDRNQTEIVEALRKIGCKVQSLAAVGAGVPDLLVMRGSRLFLLEVKDGAKPLSERRLTPDQVKWHSEWAGAPLVVVESVEQALAAIR
jgi:Holliday junction resolvase